MERQPRTRDFVPAAPPEESVYATAAPAASAASAVQSRMRRRWTWLPLSVVCLLLGLVLGFEAALTTNPRAGDSTVQEYSLALSVTRNGDNLSVKWDGQSPAIRAAQKGVLEIEDGSAAKPVDLDRAQLQNGTLLYRNSSNVVRFRLTVYPQARVSVTETLEWQK